MSVISRPCEPFEALLRRFRRGVEQAGILRGARRRRRFVPQRERIKQAFRRQARRGVIPA